MQRLTAIFIAICVGLIAASCGAVAYFVFHLSPAESALTALAVMTALALYNLVAARLRDRDDVGGQIADLSRGTADLARQVAEIGRRVNTLETRDPARVSGGSHGQMAAEIGELGLIVKELAETVAAHERRLRGIGTGPASAAERGEPALRSPELRPPELRPIAKRGDAAAAAEPEPAADPLKGKSADEIVATIKATIDDGRVDLYLQPVVTLPQRKVRFYEALTRLRMDDGTLVLPRDFLVHAEKSALIASIDNMQLFRCVQVLRRLLLKNREIGVFCNVSVETLRDPAIFRQFADFLDANRALSASLILEFTQSGFRAMGPVERENLGSLTGLGYGFCMDRLTDLRFGPRELSDLGVRFVKVPASLLLSGSVTAADIDPRDLSDLLGRNGITLIADRIETEPVVVDLLDYDVRFGQGFLFSPPRPVRADALRGGPAVAGRDDRQPSSGEALAAI